jgi:hypothetical protein
MHSAAIRQILTDGLARKALSTTGRIFFVSNVSGDNGVDAPTNSDLAPATARGQSPDNPFATLDYAVGQCVASRGDIIYVMPGHAETITAAAGLVFDKAGITVIGLGVGTSRPTFTLSTATTADIDVDSANVTLINLRFVSAIDDLAVILDVNEGNFTMEDCLLYGPATFEVLNFVNLATTKDNFFFRRNRFLQEADPTGTDGNAATGGIYVVDSENILVEDCSFDGYFETACLHNKTTALKYLTWRRNSVNQQLTITGDRIRLVAGTVGCSIGVDNDFMPGFGYRIQKTEDVNTATSDDLFTVTGKNLIVVWTGEVTDALNASPTDYALGIKTGATMQAAGNLASASLGFVFMMNGDAGDTTLAAGSNAVSVVRTTDTNGKGLANRIIGLDGLGSVSLNAVRTAGAAGDAIVHTIWYVPLEPGAGIKAAA